MNEEIFLVACLLLLGGLALLVLAGSPAGLPLLLAGALVMYFGIGSEGG